MAKTLVDEAEETAQVMLARLRGYAKETRHTDDERKDAAIFHRSLNGAANIIATNRSAAAFQMALARQLTSDPVELERYSVSPCPMPHSRKPCLHRAGNNRDRP